MRWDSFGLRQSRVSGLAGFEENHLGPEKRPSDKSMLPDPPWGKPGEPPP